MSGWSLTRSHVTAWNTAALSDLAGVVTAAVTTYSDQVGKSSQHFADLGSAWIGRARDVAYDRVIADRRNADKIGYEVTDLATVLTQASSSLFWERDNLLRKAADAEAPDAAGSGAKLTVSDTWKIAITYPANATDTDRTAIDVNAEGFQGLIDKAWFELRDTAQQVDRLIREAAQQIRAAGNGFGDSVDQPVTPGTADPGPSPAETIKEMPYAQKGDPYFGYSEERTKTSAAAFEAQFGHPPNSQADWATAHALNPQTYDPKTKGAQANIIIARIDPVPGQGVVRTAQFIRERDVADPSVDNPLGRNKGDNRSPDPDFDPEASRVTTYVDYENGIVIVRQNPSVVQEADNSSGHVEAGKPQASVVQATDGAVRVKYDASDPIGMGGVMDDYGWSVNGDLVFTPTDKGVTIDGTRTNYPWLEAYQTTDSVAARQIAVDPPTGVGTGSSFGPSINLQGHHDVGVGGRAFTDDKWKGWNSEYDVRYERQGVPLGDPKNPPTVTGGLKLPVA